MWPIVNMPEEDRATDRNNMHKKFGKDRACGCGDILADRQTHRQTYSSQYFTTAPASEVINTFQLQPNNSHDVDLPASEQMAAMLHHSWTHDRHAYLSQYFATTPDLKTFLFARAHSPEAPLRMSV